MNSNTVIILGLIACVCPVWMFPSENYVDMGEIRHEYCISNFCEPFDDCYMFTFCRYALLHQKQLDDKEAGTMTDYEKHKDMTMPLFNKTVKLIPSSLAKILRL